MPGKMARSDPRLSVRVTRGAGSGHTSRLSCKRAGKTRTLMPVWDSSGESRFNVVLVVLGLCAAALRVSVSLRFFRAAGGDDAL